MSIINGVREGGKRERVVGVRDQKVLRKKGRYARVVQNLRRAG